MTTEKKPKKENKYTKMYKHLETTNKNIQDWEFADLRGQDPKVIFESLFEQVENDTVTILPEMKAPKYLQKLNDGEIKELGKG